MTKETRVSRPEGEPFARLSAWFQLAGARYWTASLLSALVGTTLPFWLRPAGFSFQWLGAVEFLGATILFHAGFSILRARFEGEATAQWPEFWSIASASACLILACLVGLHLNRGLPLKRFVYEDIFIIYGLAVIVVGILYVMPPISFWRRVGGEVVVSESLGLLPVLGAYLVQVGDLTRTVYLAALPIVVATGLWVWMDELASRVNDERTGRRTMVLLFGARFSARFGVLALSMLLCGTLLLAVLTASLNPLALAALLFVGILWSITAVSWNEYACPKRMMAVCRQAFKLHLATCLWIAVSSMAPFVGSW